MNDIKDFTRNIIYDETVKGFICTDKFYNELKDYITNLQQEYENFRKLKERYQLEKEVYKSRINKAIKYIEKEYQDNIIITDNEDKPITPQELYGDLLNILKGDSDETV